jgi:hypothetical protein
MNKILPVKKPLPTVTAKSPTPVTPVHIRKENK